MIEPLLPGDALPDAPALATRGPHPAGVTTRTLTLPDAVDLAASSAGEVRRGARVLTAEIWYPAAAGAIEQCRYEDRLGRAPGDPARPDTAFHFAGRAARDAAPAARRSPLVLVSHGHPGSRVLLSYLCEHMASCGRVVMALDHPGSVHGRVGEFAETLLHRATDVIGALDAAATLDADDPLLAGRIEADRVALVGYSMGGYGVLNVAGAGHAQAFIDNSRAVPHRLLAPRGAAAPGFAADPRVRAVIAFAPWGGQHRVWEPSGLAALAAPTLFVVGSDDDVVGFDPGVCTLFRGACGAAAGAVRDAHRLLVYRGCRHNPAPNPPPDAARAHVEDWAHYAEPVWDPRRLNNLNQHFVRAFLDRHLDGLEAPALDVIEIAADGGWRTTPDGRTEPGPDHWWGFRPRTALGVELHRPPSGEAG